MTEAGTRIHSAAKHICHVFNEANPHGPFAVVRGPVMRSAHGGDYEVCIDCNGWIRYVRLRHREAQGTSFELYDRLRGPVLGVIEQMLNECPGWGAWETMQPLQRLIEELIGVSEEGGDPTHLLHGVRERAQALVNIVDHQLPDERDPPEQPTPPEPVSDRGPDDDRVIDAEIDCTANAAMCRREPLDISKAGALTDPGTTITDRRRAKELERWTFDSYQPQPCPVCGLLTGCMHPRRKS